MPIGSRPKALGDETPGGDNPTPDQDVVDEIGRALGVEYDDDEELQGGAEIADRDTHRWELDPNSKDDFDEEEKIDWAWAWGLGTSGLKPQALGTPWQHDRHVFHVQILVQPPPPAFPANARILHAAKRRVGRRPAGRR